jgi:hypothetical protein
MKDNDFKKLVHIADNYAVTKSGSELDKGYKPDTVLQKGKNYIIMECDTGTSRKGYLGAMIKAAKFLTKEKKGILVLVIKEKSNTKVSQIHQHLQNYYNWVKPLTNLNAVYLISHEKYCPSDTPIKILGKDFGVHCLKICL